MTHHLGLSGSVIMTDENRLTELFRDDLDHVEIGEFKNEKAFQEFLQLLKDSNHTFGIHSPIYRNESKYDLLEKVFYEPEVAWKQFESEVKRLSLLGAKYVLVHFPYFKGEITGDVNQIIEEGLQKLSRLQETYQIPIVCEPKLGLGRSPIGIQYLEQFPIEIWERYKLHICIDIGDYLMATGDVALDYIKKWQKFIKVVHLHNVEFLGDEYFWVPVHSSHENSGTHYQIRDILSFLAACGDVFFVFEHTPHTNPTTNFVDEGIKWVKQLVL